MRFSKEKADNIFLYQLKTDFSLQSLSKADPKSEEGWYVDTYI